MASPSGVWLSNAEMAAARFVSVQGVDAHELGQLEKVSDAAGFLERLVQLLAVPSTRTFERELARAVRESWRARAAGFASDRVMPQLSHISLPSSRCRLSTVRWPFVCEELSMRSATSASTWRNAALRRVDLVRA